MATPLLTEKMTDEEFEQHALAILSRELGLAGYARYLRLFHSGKGDYTTERQQWLSTLTLDDILGDLELLRQQAE